jgi:hypothetical protein
LAIGLIDVPAPSVPDEPPATAEPLPVAALAEGLAPAPEPSVLATEVGL